MLPCSFNNVVMNSSFSFDLATALIEPINITILFSIIGIILMVSKTGFCGIFCYLVKELLKMSS